MKNLVTNTTADARKGNAFEAPIAKFPLAKIRYKDDNMFPFEVLCDVPRVAKKALDAINLNQIPGKIIDYRKPPKQVDSNKKD